MGSLAKEFLRYMELQRRCSPLTLRNYRHDIELFEVWIVGEYGDHITLESVSAEVIRNWIIYRLEGDREANLSPLSPASMNRALATLRSLYRYAEEREIVERNPTRAIKSLKTAKPLPHFVPETKMAQLIKRGEEREEERAERDEKEGQEAQPNSAENWIEERDELIIEFLYLTGLRLSEIAQIRMHSFTDDYRQVKVLGKGNKERIVPIVPSLRTKILSHFSKINTLLIWRRASNCLFLSSKACPLSTSGIYRIVRRRMLEGGVAGRKSPHILRHTFATHLLSRGADIRVIQELLGHESLEATQRYTHNSIATLKRAYKKSHPRGS